MTILLYDHYELEERPSRPHKAWKAWHMTLYVFAGIFGIMNYVFLQNTMTLIDNNCVLYPRQLEFHMVNLTSRSNGVPLNTTEMPPLNHMTDGEAHPSTVPNNITVDHGHAVKREVNESEATTPIPKDSTERNKLVEAPVNRTQLMLDVSRTVFSKSCDFASYIPILSTMFACVWGLMFTICWGGARATGLQQPWRVLSPALLFAAVMVGLTGHSFNVTNGGLHAFCSGFSNFTNSTSCSAVNQYLELGWNSTWSMGGRIAAARAASAGVWASWACIAALLLARCLVAPDFQLKKTEAILIKDPQQKIAQHLKKQRRTARSNQSSPVKRDTASVRSEPTITTELVTASIEQDHISLPSSLTSTPLPKTRNQELIELNYSPNERHVD